MSGGRRAIERRHIEALRQVRSWVEMQGTNPLAAGVLEDLEGQIEGWLRRRAIVNVRAKNLGTPKKLLAIPSRRTTRAIKQGDARRYRFGIEWSLEDIERLRALFDAGRTFEQIGNELDRSFNAVQDQVRRMGLKRRKPNPTLTRGFVLGNAYKENPRLAAARRIRERRLAAMQERKEA